MDPASAHLAPLSLRACLVDRCAARFGGRPPGGPVRAERNIAANGPAQFPLNERLNRAGPLVSASGYGPRVHALAGMY